MRKYKYIGPQELITPCEFHGKSILPEAPCHHGCGGYIEGECPFCRSYPVGPKSIYAKHFEVSEE